MSEIYNPNFHKEDEEIPPKKSGIMRHSPGMISGPAVSDRPMSEERKEWMRTTELYATMVQELGEVAAEAVLAR